MAERELLPEARKSASELLRERPELLDALAVAWAHLSQMPDQQRWLLLATLDDSGFADFYNGYMVGKFGVKPTPPHPYERYKALLRNKRT